MTKKVTWNVMHIAVGLSRGEKSSSRALAPTPICSQAAEQHTDYSLRIQKEMRHKEYSFNLCRVFLVT